MLHSLYDVTSCLDASPMFFLRGSLEVEGRSLSRWGGSIWRISIQWGSLWKEGLCDRRVSVKGGLCESDGDPGHWRRQYASYWNAFLFWLNWLQYVLIEKKSEKPKKCTNRLWILECSREVLEFWAIQKIFFFFFFYFISKIRFCFTISCEPYLKDFRTKKFPHVYLFLIELLLIANKSSTPKCVVIKNLSRCS